MAALLCVSFCACLSTAARAERVVSRGEHVNVFDIEIGAGVNAPINPAAVADDMVLEGCVEDLAVQYERLFKELDLPFRTTAKWLFGFKSHKLSSPAVIIGSGQPQPPALYTAIQNRFQKEKAFSNSGGLDSKLKQQLREAKDIVKSFGFSVQTAKGTCQVRQAEPRPESIAECMAAVISSGQTYGRVLRATNKMRGLISTKFVLWEMRGLSEAQALELVTPLKVLEALHSWHSATIEDAAEQEEQSKLIGLVKAAASNSTDALQSLVDFRQVKQARYDLLTLTQASYKKESVTLFKAVSRAEAELKRAKQLLKGFGFSFDKTRKACISQRRHQSPQEGAAMMARMVRQVNDPVMVAEGIVGNRKCAEKTETYCPAGMAPKWTRKDFDFKSFLKVYMLGVVTWGNPTAVGIMGLGGLIVGGPAGMGLGVALALGTPTEWILPVPVALWNSADFFPKCRCSMSPCEYDEEEKACVMKPDRAVSNPFAWLPHPGTKCVMKTQERSDFRKPSCTVQTCLAEDFSPNTSLDRIRGKVGTLESSDGWRIRGTYNCLADDDDAALWLRPDLSDLVPDLQYNSTDGVATTKAFTRVYELLLGPEKDSTSY